MKLIGFITQDVAEVVSAVRRQYPSTVAVSVDVHFGGTRDGQRTYGARVIITGLPDEYWYCHIVTPGVVQIRRPATRCTVHV